jgi:hypothetical protein
MANINNNKKNFFTWFENTKPYRIRINENQKFLTVWKRGHIDTKKYKQGNIKLVYQSGKIESLPFSQEVFQRTHDPQNPNDIVIDMEGCSEFSGIVTENEAKKIAENKGMKIIGQNIDDPNMSFWITEKYYRIFQYVEIWFAIDTKNPKNFGNTIVIKLRPRSEIESNNEQKTDKNPKYNYIVFGHGSGLASFELDSEDEPVILISNLNIETGETKPILICKKRNYSLNSMKSIANEEMKINLPTSIKQVVDQYLTCNKNKSKKWKKIPYNIFDDYYF